ncbi:ATP synthase subunit O mitochondrial [Tripterygium wilfordii]|uniref:ATP synthase subunit O mitochondrial n=1 Tax=Tripterygium wilfordii TaxID=458696 RepID=A0A7J7CRD3_TRIWF|nr:ATP synthase subunit O, mitochondrial-like [Tripterygium wilfordii]KAF5736436.1 ATP synthase subunit O mitochondrial [Tripterygium wilfordii]
MAMAGRIRSSLPLLNKIIRSDSLSTQTSTIQRALLCPTFTQSEFSGNYSTASGKKEEKVKVPLALYGGSGNYASALYLAAAKSNVLDQVESEILDVVEAINRSPKFSQFTKDLSVPADIRIKAIKDICAHATLSDITKNFLILLAENRRLRNIDSIAKKFNELTMAHKGIVKAIVTTVIPLPPQEEKELKETLQDIIGQGKTVKVEQKIDPSILGGLVVEFGQKVFDMSIKTRAKQMERYLREPIDVGNL